MADKVDPVDHAGGTNQCVAPPRHRRRPGMRFLTGYRDFVPALALGAGDDADRLARRFEDRPLLDMRLEIGGNRLSADRLGTGKADPPEFGAEGDPCQVVGTGQTLGAELGRIGFAGPEPVGGKPVAAYFEAHIEQGPILEAAGKPIGVVTGAQGQRWYEVTVTGQEAHAGPTPMKRRRDSLVGAARMIDRVNHIGHGHAPYACATVGFVQVSPNSRNTIPGRVFFTVDFRHPYDPVLTEMDRELRAACQEAASANGLKVEVKEFWYFPPTPFHSDLVGAVRDAAAVQGYPHQDIASGAGHDAVYMARVAPSAMVFVPCVGGISHNEIEDAKPEDLTAGCNVLFNAVLDRANATSDRQANE